MRPLPERHIGLHRSIITYGMALLSTATLGLLLSMILTYPDSMLQILDPEYAKSTPRITPQSVPVRSTPPEPATLPQTTPVAITPDVHFPPIVDGLVPVVASVPTDQPVVFLTIDDGAHKTPDELETLQANHIKASLFLAKLFIASEPDFFTDFQTAGYPIEDHSLDHLIDEVSIESYAVQKNQICGMADYEEQHYGRRPIFFRPPGGSYSTAMRQAAADCGMKAIVTWIAKANGGSMQYQIGDHLRPGDIVLMHFRPEFQQDFKAFLDAANSQHLRTELLEDWL